MTSPPKALRRGRLRGALGRLRDRIARSPRVVPFEFPLPSAALPDEHVISIDLLAGLSDSEPVSEPPQAIRPERLARYRQQLEKQKPGKKS